MTRTLPLLALLACLAAAALSGGAAAVDAAGGEVTQAGDQPYKPEDPAKSAADEAAANEALAVDTPAAGPTGYIGQPLASCAATATSAPGVVQAASPAAAVYLSSSESQPAAAPAQQRQQLGGQTHLLLMTLPPCYPCL